ncbi:hypothetical protein Q5P01_000101 [Channa striata]|uniref:Uncharacterized protein n=1 Tax=Channa striata TaxID=64152 RepID=A0AA88LEF1_CHASR|nr:hypothetical protein Q5P01_000101 [Channa striata]
MMDMTLRVAPPPPEGSEVRSLRAQAPLDPNLPRHGGTSPKAPRPLAPRRRRAEVSVEPSDRPQGFETSTDHGLRRSKTGRSPGDGLSQARSRLRGLLRIRRLRVSAQIALPATVSPFRTDTGLQASGMDAQLTARAPKANRSKAKDDKPPGFSTDIVEECLRKYATPADREKLKDLKPSCSPPTREMLQRCSFRRG